MKKSYAKLETKTELWRIDCDPLFVYKKRTYRVSIFHEYITDYGFGLDRFCIWVHVPQTILKILKLS